MKSQHIYFTLINQRRINVSLSKESVYQDLCPSVAARNDGKTSRRGSVSTEGTALRTISGRGGGVT